MTPQSALKEAVERVIVLEAENEALTKALTGLTCGGSEFFNRKGDRYVADIAACVAWVRRNKTEAHRRTVDALLENKRQAESLEAMASALERIENGLPDHRATHRVTAMRQCARTTLTQYRKTGDL